MPALKGKNEVPIFMPSFVRHLPPTEPRTIVREYGGRWDRTAIDREELARLRFVEKWPLKRIPENYVGAGRKYARNQNPPANL
jgi:hypothetical protein